VVSIWTIAGSARSIAFSASETFTWFRAHVDASSAVALAVVLIGWLGGQGSDCGAGFAVEFGCSIASSTVMVAVDFHASTVVLFVQKGKFMLVVFACLAV